MTIRHQSTCSLVGLDLFCQFRENAFSLHFDVSDTHARTQTNEYSTL